MQTSDGLEQTLAVNYYSHALLTLQLLDIMVGSVQRPPLQALSSLTAAEELSPTCLYSSNTHNCRPTSCASGQLAAVGLCR
jgi:hypothetical protein